MEIPSVGSAVPKPQGRLRETSHSRKWDWKEKTKQGKVSAEVTVSQSHRDALEKICYNVEMPPPRSKEAGVLMPLHPGVIGNELFFVGCKILGTPGSACFGQVGCTSLRTVFQKRNLDSGAWAGKQRAGVGENRQTIPWPAGILCLSSRRAESRGLCGLLSKAMLSQPSLCP